ncbi:hypothetical protein DSO57_1022712 [Entomophthora muscae]|uniref:Uncharacterized protein n=1 Tax=Entomophthora muscae TaxID=34485 RepID=A0ACC2RHV1_9FUNG|nr:hypothetical protein DSO57_1022712 [Entomophthora muscae]
MKQIVLLGLIQAKLMSTGYGNNGSATYSIETSGMIKNLQGLISVLGKCSFPLNEYPLWAAVSSKTYHGAQYCGTCLEVSNPSDDTTVVVHVVDQCQGCSSNGINLSLKAFEKLSEKDIGKLAINWKEVQCPDIQGNIHYHWEKGSTQSFSAFQIRNHAEPIKGVAYRIDKSKKWIEIPRRSDNFFTLSGIRSPFFVKITSVSNHTIFDYGLKPNFIGGTVIGHVQFGKVFME